ncbi:MAG: DNA translocase FtsK, partial [Cyanobacteria bacterium J06649_11]
DKVALKMQQIFYRIKFFPYLQQTITKDISKGKQLLQVWQGLQGIIKRFAQILIVNRHYCNADNVINKTFILENRQLEHNFDLPNGIQQQVRGEYDCLIYNYEHHKLCLVEFKTYQPVDPSAQLAQASLYGYMLFQKKQLPVDSAVYCVLPEFKEYYYGWEQLENTVNQLIPYKLRQMQEWLSWEPSRPNAESPPATTQPYLCEICPQQQKCQNYFKTREEIEVNNSSANQTPLINQDSDPTAIFPAYDSGLEVNQEEVKIPQENSVDAEAIGRQLVNTLQSFKIGVNFIGAAIAPSFIRIKLKPHSGVKINSIQKLYADLQEQMEL